MSFIIPCFFLIFIVRKSCDSQRVMKRMVKILKNWRERRGTFVDNNNNPGIRGPFQVDKSSLGHIWRQEHGHGDRQPACTYLLGHLPCLYFKLEPCTLEQPLTPTPTPTRRDRNGVSGHWFREVFLAPACRPSQPGTP